jgi:hypothetical protein
MMLTVTQVRGKLAFQGTLENSLDQIPEHGPLAGKPQPAVSVSRPLQKSVQQLVAEQVPHPCPARQILAALIRYVPVDRSSRLSPNRARHSHHFL